MLRIEYMTDNENKSETENKIINETTKWDWENGKTFEALKDKNNDKWKNNNKKSAEDWTGRKILRERMIKIKKHWTLRKITTI